MYFTSQVKIPTIFTSASNSKLRIRELLHFWTFLEYADERVNDKDVQTSCSNYFGTLQIKKSTLNTIHFRGPYIVAINSERKEKPGLPP